MFTYVGRREVSGWLAGLALASIPLSALTGVLDIRWLPAPSVAGSPGAALSVALGALLTLVWWMVAFKLAIAGLRDAADGIADERAREHPGNDGQALSHVLLWLAVLALGYVALLWKGWPALALVAAGGALVLPATVALLAMDDGLLHALDPRAVLEMLRRLGGDYLALSAKAALLALAAFALSRGLFAPLLPGWLAGAASRFVVLLALVAGYRALGLLLHARRADLDLPEAPSIPRPALANAAEDNAMREADALAAEDKPTEAAARLDPLIRGQGASAPVHARYRELLALAGDRDGLLNHARAYIAVLLHLGQERPALQLYRASREADPAFELDTPEALSRMIAFAARTGQSQLAVALAEEFARRFPRDRDLVRNGLTAATLMADRLGRDAEAEALLRGLLAAQPEHPLAPDLEAALQAIAPRR